MKKFVKAPEIHQAAAGGGVKSRRKRVPSTASPNRILTEIISYRACGLAAGRRPMTRAAQSRPRLTISRAWGTSKSAATWPSDV